MTDKKEKAALKVFIAVMVMSLLFTAFGSVYIASAQNVYGKTIYLKTDRTTEPYLHYWYRDGKTESTWPGVAMSKVKGETDIYFYDLPYDISELNGVIFNNGGNGDKMTDDVTNITGNLYTLNSENVGVWSTYDTSSIQINQFGGIPNTPIYTNQSVWLSMNAEGGDGRLEYKFSVSGASDEIISDYSKRSSAVWTPTVAGDYTVAFEVKDGLGESNIREMTYSVIDSATAVEPVFLGVVPISKTQVKKGDDVTVNVRGSGGNINNNVLFYKAEILDPNGESVNVPYYKTDNKFTFTADTLGTYTVYISIQNNTVKNTTTKATCFYSCVENPSNDDHPEITPPVPVTGITVDQTVLELKVGEVAELKAAVAPANADDKNVIWTSSNEKAATVSNGRIEAVGSGIAIITAKARDGGFTAKCTVTVKSDNDGKFIPGDFDGNGVVTLSDAQSVQRAALGKNRITDEQLERSDVNGDGEITLKDAALIKQFALGEITGF